MFLYLKLLKLNRRKLQSEEENIEIKVEKMKFKP